MKVYDKTIEKLTSCGVS